MEISNNTIETNDIVERLFHEGLILPSNTKRSLALWNYKIDQTFSDKKLNTRWKICPELFTVGHNVINDPKYLKLNLYLVSELQNRFPGVSFENEQDIDVFVNSPTFYRVKDTTMLIGHDVFFSNYSDENCIFIRICPGYPLGDYVSYSYQELISTFLHYNEFVDPRSPTFKRFSTLEINRLCYLLSEIQPTDCLNDIIESINRRLIQHNECLMEMKRYIWKNMEIGEEFFTKLLYIGMKMRGWSGMGPYPLRNKDTYNIIDLDEILSELFTFHQECNNRYFTLSQNFLFLHLNDTFQTSLFNEDGFTIADRINIILQNKNENACIRVSSNWLLSTTWYYMNTGLGQIPFHIEDLDLIY